MQCYEFEALCRILVEQVTSIDPTFSLLDAADFISDIGVDKVTQLDDLLSAASDIRSGVQRAA